jgi:hypothetical protein
MMRMKFLEIGQLVGARNGSVSLMVFFDLNGIRVIAYAQRNLSIRDKTEWKTRR